MYKLKDNKLGEYLLGKYYLYFFSALKGECSFIFCVFLSIYYIFTFQKNIKMLLKN